MLRFAAPHGKPTAPRLPGTNAAPNRQRPRVPRGHDGQRPRHARSGRSRTVSSTYADHRLRDPQTGNPVSIDLSYTNEGRSVTSGVDLQLNWSTMLESGGINLNLLANYNMENSTQAGEGLPEIDWAGTLGCALQLQCMGYDYRVFSTLNYVRGNWATASRWQHWPSIKVAAYATNPNTVLPGVSSSYDLFALSASYQLSQRYTIRMGVENLFDKDPPLSGGNPVATPFPTAPTHAGGATYDPLGRRFFASVTMDF